MKNKQKLSLSVPDMMCVHCEATIEKALAALGAKAKANNLSKEVTVVYDGTLLDEARIRAAITDAGYTIA